MTVTFSNYDEFVEFQNEAEGMWEVARDDEDEARVKNLHDLIQCIENQMNARGDYPWTPAIPEHLLQLAQDVSDNMEGNQ